MSQNMTNFDSSFESNSIVGCAWLIHLVITASIVFNFHTLDNVLSHLIYNVSYIMYRIHIMYIHPFGIYMYTHNLRKSASLAYIMHTYLFNKRILRYFS